MAKPRKYQPLVDHLAAQPVATVTVSFVEIEGLIGAPLPQLAPTRTWWHNSRPHWLLRAAGWRVAHVDFAAHTVTFAR